MVKQKNYKKLIKVITSIIIILILLLVLIIVRIANIQKEKRQQLEKVNSYTTINDFKSIEEVANYLECDYIKEEKSKDENYSIDIYLKIKKLPYIDNSSNELYYKKLISYSANVLKYESFKIIDEKNSITIEVICNSELGKIKNILINGEDNYFSKRDSELELKSFKEIKQTNINIQSDIIKKLIDSNWRINDSDLGTKESTFNSYNIYFDEGIELRKVDNKVFNIVFTNKYKSNIVNNITTTTSKENVINILGEPTFKDEVTQLIGYKGKDIYVFWNSKNEVSIYPVNQETDSTQFSEIIDKYLENRNIQELIENLKVQNKDYDLYESDSNGIVLQYSLKGILFRFRNGLEKGVEIYNNYSGYICNNVKNNENIELLPDCVYIKNQDLVEKAEIKRVNRKNDMIFNVTSEISKDNTLSKSEKFYTIRTMANEDDYSIKFLSIDGEYANSELKDYINYYIWIDDYNFIYSIKNRGIYLYNAKTRIYATIVEQTDSEFKIINYENGILKYDDKTIRLIKN